MKIVTIAKKVLGHLKPVAPKPAADTAKPDLQPGYLGRSRKAVARVVRAA